MTDKTPPRAVFPPDNGLREILGTLAGHASLCWNPRPTGVFDTAEARKAVNDAYARIAPLVEALDAWCAKYEAAHKTHALSPELIAVLAEYRKLTNEKR